MSFNTIAINLVLPDFFGVVAFCMTKINNSKDNLRKKINPKIVLI